MPLKEEFNLRIPARIMTLAIALLLATGIALSWNKAGHMVTAAIAYDELRQSSEGAIGRVIKILKEHPQFDARWKPQLAGMTAQEQERALLMLAARWPDDIRGDDDFHQPAWHFINHPYKPAGTPASVQTANPDADNITTAFHENAAILNSTADDSDKAIALCWIFHLIGDAHQPLHSTSLFTQQFPAPQGDRGGTRFFIRAKKGAATISLHKFWDDLILGSEQFTHTTNRATALRNNPANARSTFPELTETAFTAWVKPESFNLADSHAYCKGDIKGSKNENAGTILPSDYAATVKAPAERRAVLAGYRLADFLKTIP